MHKKVRQRVRVLAKTIRSLAKTLMVMMTVSVVLAVCFGTILAEFDYTPVEVKVPVTCEITGKSAEGTYEFVIEKLDEDSPSAKNGLISINGSGTDSFIIVVGEPGTYRYKVYEKAGSNGNVTYDDTVYKVTVYVTSNDKGQLEYQIILTKDDMVKPTEVSFVNVANSSPAPIPSTGEDVSIYTTGAVIILSLGTAMLLAVLRKRREAENA